MDKQPHNDAGDTKIIFRDAEAESGAELGAHATPREEPPTGISWASRWSSRPALIVGALAIAALSAAGLTAVAAGAATDTPSSAAAGRPADGKPDKIESVNGRAANDRSDKVGKDSGAKGAGRSDASPSPSHVGLCRAYRSKVGDHPGKALESPAFTSLITAAGGKDGVGAYCARVLEAKEREDKDKGKGNGADRSEAKGENGADGRANGDKNADRGDRDEG